MKFLGIDYGTKRIGLAVSDEDGVLAFPKSILANDSSVFSSIGKIFKDENISEAVIGESVDFSGELNPVAIKAEAFSKEFAQKFNVVVHKEKEFLTSIEARKGIVTKESLNANNSHSKMSKEDGGRADASAAALILQRFLDKHNQAKS